MRVTSPSVGHHTTDVAPGTGERSGREGEEEALLDRRHDLESAIDPSVPKSMKGPDAPTV